MIGFTIAESGDAKTASKQRTAEPGGVTVRFNPALTVSIPGGEQLRSIVVLNVDDELRQFSWQGKVVV